jgi:hydrogenase maturation protein HypF
MLALRDEFPAPGILTSVRESAREELDCNVPGEFQILPSESDAPPVVQIPPDLKMCDNCQREVFDPDDRRFGYPVTTCTVCGPRYTVVEAMPYDRERTTLNRFPLCDDCLREYTDVRDRRFHAESIACPKCGPTVWFEKNGAYLKPEASGPDAIRKTREALRSGEIVAVRGIGGFLLAADALNRRTLEILRERKARPHKPFAVMVDSVATARELCLVEDSAGALLASSAAPIVILPIKERAANDRFVSGVGEPAGTQSELSGVLPLDLITPDTETIGMMLPTSPLHQLLFRPLPGDPTPAFRVLVMTSRSVSPARKRGVVSPASPTHS